LNQIWTMSSAMAGATGASTLNSGLDVISMRNVGVLDWLFWASARG
jgi:hypothetical protein